MMSGKRHDLVSAAVIAEGGRAVWRHVDKARMFVRPLSYTFIEAYLDAEWPAIAGCVGCYRMEGPGVQLFSRVEGNHFTVLGMPLMPLLSYLRERQVLPA
jgi:septum formation protein